MTTSFGPCEICGNQSWRIIYQGIVRDGVFGRERDGATVARCGGCGADRLDEASCPNDGFYETAAYRKKLEEELTTEGHYAVSDELQIFTQQNIWPKSIRGKVVADVGCAGGSFLDHVLGLAKQIIAVEPCPIYHESLKKRGYHVFPYATNACETKSGIVDIAVSSQVIEHVRNPRRFLEDIRPLLSSKGLLLISTPNRDDILMSLLPAEFPAFFYRVVHRWYFDMKSLAECVRRAGYEVVGTRFVHRYGMANALAWLRDRRPTGRQRIDAIGPLADELWCSYLAQSGRTDCIYMILQPVITP
jgi:SAM-dependent methyltransferase